MSVVITVQSLQKITVGFFFWTPFALPHSNFYIMMQHSILCIHWERLHITAVTVGTANAMGITVAVSVLWVLLKSSNTLTSASWSQTFVSPLYFICDIWTASTHTGVKGWLCGNHTNQCYSSSQNSHHPIWSQPQPPIFSVVLSSSCSIEKLKSSMLYAAVRAQPSFMDKRECNARVCLSINQSSQSKNDLHMCCYFSLYQALKSDLWVGKNKQP